MSRYQKLVMKINDKFPSILNSSVYLSAVVQLVSHFPAKQRPNPRANGQETINWSTWVS